VRPSALIHVPLILVALGAGSAFAADPADAGIPVRSDLVKSACGACHEQDDTGRMTRISYERKTPEAWELTLKRMMRTGRVQLSPEQAREIIRYLGDDHGLAPAEARAVLYRAEKRPTLETAVNDEVGETCNRCHLAAWYLSQRRTKEEWQLLKGMHLGYFPIIEYQTFRGSPPGEQGGDDAPRARGAAPPTTAGPPDERWRVDRVLDWLAENYGFETAEWKEYRAKRSSRDLSGKWLFTTHQPTKGLASGTIVFEKTAAGYTTRADIALADGKLEKRTGTGVLYSDLTWRGRSEGTSLLSQREVLGLSDDGSTLEGRFFRGEYGELGLDVRMVRLASDARIAGVSPKALAAPGEGSATSTLRILGANLTASVAPGDIDLGPGLSVTRIQSQTPERLEVEVAVQSDAPPGRRNVRVGATTALDALAVYAGIDYVKVRPEEGLARTGGGAIAKQFVQFEAVAYANGPDGEPLTADDVELNVVSPAWSLEEYHVIHEDEDLRYVGAIDENGLFTPNLDGPNPERKRATNNMGDVWAVAAYTPPGASRPLHGRAHLIVAPPIYTYWDFQEVFP
jgi:quinohemoprotein amine dehydrogenase